MKRPIALAVLLLAAPPAFAGPAEDMAAMPRCVWSTAPAFEKGRINGAMADLNLAAVDVLSLHLAEDSVDPAGVCAQISKRDGPATQKILLIGFNQESLADQLTRAGLSREKLDAAIAAAPAGSLTAARSLAEQAGARRIDPSRTPAMKPVFEALGQPTFDGAPKTPLAYMISTYVLNAFQLKVLGERYAAPPG